MKINISNSIQLTLIVEIIITNKYNIISLNHEKVRKYWITYNVEEILIIKWLNGIKMFNNEEKRVIFNLSLKKNRNSFYFLDKALNLKKR